MWANVQGSKGPRLATQEKTTEPYENHAAESEDSTHGFEYSRKADRLPRSVHKVEGFIPRRYNTQQPDRRSLGRQRLLSLARPGRPQPPISVIATAGGEGPPATNTDRISEESPRRQVRRVRTWLGGKGGFSGRGGAGGSPIRVRSSGFLVRTTWYRGRAHVPRAG